MITKKPYEYPTWVPPVIQPSEPRRSSINSTTENAREINVTSAAIGSPIPLAYGLCELAPLIFALATDASYLVVGCAWCLGEIESIQIYDGDNPIPPTWVRASYNGAPGQPVDPTLAGVIPGYADTLEMQVRGETVTVAYSVLRIPVTSNFPTLKAIIKGKRSWSGGAVFYPSVNIADTGTAQKTLYYANGTNAPTEAAPEVIDLDISTFNDTFMYADPRDPARPSYLYVDIQLPAAEPISRLEYEMANTAYIETGDIYNTTVPAEFTYELAYFDTTTNAWEKVPNTLLWHPDNGLHSFDLNPRIVSDRFRLIVWNPARAIKYWFSVKRAILRPHIYEFRVFGTRQSQYAYTSNPAVVLGDFCASKAYGLGREVDVTSLQNAIDWCDETMPDGFPRNTVGIALLTRQEVTNHIEALRAYANCLVASQGDKVFLIPNRPSPVTGQLTETDIVEGSIELSQISMSNVPTVVYVTRTDSTSWPWKTRQKVSYHPKVLTGEYDYRRQEISMPGIHHPGQAERVSIQRLNYYSLSNLRMECTVFDKGISHMVGDVVEVTISWGLNKKQMRIIGMEATSAGRYRLTMEEYDPKIYSDTIETVPSYPDTMMQVLIQQVTILSVNQNANEIYVTWSDIRNLYPFLDSIELQVVEMPADNIVQSATFSPDTTKFKTKSLPLGDYEVRVFTYGEYNGVRSKSAPAVQAITLV